MYQTGMRLNENKRYLVSFSDKYDLLNLINPIIKENQA